jgi:hypothetical protein
MDRCVEENLQVVREQIGTQSPSTCVNRTKEKSITPSHFSRPPGVLLFWLAEKRFGLTILLLVMKHPAIVHFGAKIGSET